MGCLLDGKALSVRCNRALKAKVEALSRPPGLAVILVGDDPASSIYVRRKGVVARRVGFLRRQHCLDATVHMEEVESLIDALNVDPMIDGILLQLPLPLHLDEAALVERICVEKDVDGFTAQSMGRLAQGRPLATPCTPLGVMLLIQSTGIDLAGKQAVVVGRSNIVGRPMAMLLEQANCTVTLCHSRTVALSEVVRQADVLVVAVGRPRCIAGSWIKPGSVVIDVGINRLDDGSLVGDVDLEGALKSAAWVTPVPGGVGPMTIAMLMQNTYASAAKRQKRAPLKIT